MQGFNQAPPQIGNQYDDDRVLRGYLQRHLNGEKLNRAHGDLETMGRLAAAELLQQQQGERRQEPYLDQWDAWGNRVDRIELTPLWRKAHAIAAKAGLVATAYEGGYQPDARLIQFALVYLFHPSTDMFSCPLAMTDGAARVLLKSGNQDLIHRAVGRLTSRDPAKFWTSGQWMTETTGGSDVSGSETIARQDSAGNWRLTGRKWFTSAATSEMALTLARPEGNHGGGSGLALFYLETRDGDGRSNGIEILRLKDKLGTRKLPTAELMLNNTAATPVTELENGVRNIAPMLNITRTWNSVCAISFMRRGIALARDYANRRVVFGRPLAEQPLHQATLASLQAEFEACFHLTFHVVRLLGLSDNEQLDPAQIRLLRLLIPITKLFTGKQAVAVTSEVLESFGGAGYVEDTGLPQLLRDAQVLPIWEGTTNVLSLDLLRVLASDDGATAFLRGLGALLAAADHPQLTDVVALAYKRVDALESWLQRFPGASPENQQASARNLAMAMARLFALGLLLEHASHALTRVKDPRPAAAARLFARSATIWLDPPDADDASMLSSDIYA